MTSIYLSAYKNKETPRNSQLTEESIGYRGRTFFLAYILLAGLINSFNGIPMQSRPRSFPRERIGPSARATGTSHLPGNAVIANCNGGEVVEHQRHYRPISPAATLRHSFFPTLKYSRLSLPPSAAAVLTKHLLEVAVLENCPPS